MLSKALRYGLFSFTWTLINPRTPDIVKLFSASGRFLSVLSDGTFHKKTIGARKMRHATNSK
jgi:hypothetical protein